MIPKPAFRFSGASGSAEAPSPPSTGDFLGVSPAAWAVIAAGLAFRMLACAGTEVVNTDAIFYIQQAKALYYGQYHLITESYPFLTNYSLLIAAVYPVAGDWVRAGSWISVFFGTAVMIPLYGLIRRFCDEGVSRVTLLTLAVSPTFVGMSRDILRGPVYWFFLVLGMWCFIHHLAPRRRIFGPLACLCFILAAWARIEAVLLVASSALFLILCREKDKWVRLAVFLAPVVALSCASAVYILMLKQDGVAWLGLERIPRRIAGVFDQYRMIRDMLQALIDDQYPGQITRYFFEQARSLVWLIALGTLGARVVQAMYAPYFLIFIAGLLPARRKMMEDPRLFYLALTALLALGLLLVQLLYLWAMFDRWIVLFIFPAYVFTGFGVERIIGLIQRRFPVKKAAAVLLSALLIAGLALPKTLRFDRRGDKAVFREIGYYLRDRNPGALPVSVGGLVKEIILISFYAHADMPGAPVFDRESILAPADARNPDVIRAKGFRYMLWDEKNMGPEGLAWIQGQPLRFQFLKEWSSSKLGRMRLFEVIP